ncbi:MAG: membrane protein insertion efficiency factor YidD [Sneathiellales bacterium]|nr:membrane protein insertion efficiency factor YidD [Sneathiellales bacterium]
MFNKWITFLLSLPIKVYQYGVSPYLPANCRYHPTCSSYALDALRIHGPVKGSWLALRRIGRCHPWGGQGYDPVPEKENTGCDCRSSSHKARQH